MNAWVAHLGQSTPTRSTVPTPEPAADGLLVRLLAMGVCHSDCKIMSLPGSLPEWHDEFILGHEGAGEVVGLGSNVSKSDFQIGDKVAIFINPGCGDCHHCRRGLYQICTTMDRCGGYGLGHNGMFAEYLAVRTDAAFKVPTRVSIEEAAVAADAVLTAYHAVAVTGNVQPSDTIAIYGLGGLGINALQTAIHLKAKRIIVVDQRQSVLDAAIKLGIPREDTFCTGDPNARKIENLVFQDGVQIDTAFDFVGRTETSNSAQMSVRRGGLVVTVGLFDTETTLQNMWLVRNAITLKGSYGGSFESMEECLRLMDQGIIKPSVETGSVEDLPKVLTDLDEGKIKSRMVLLPTWHNEKSTL